MTKAIVFLKKSPDEIPPKSTNEGLLEHSASDFYFCKAKTEGGIELKALACYDFKREKWISCTPHASEVVEYYVFDADFDNWLHSTNYGLDTTADIFMSMDEADRKTHE